MNSHLAAMYNTLGAGEAVAEEQTKIASLDLFAKAAAAEQIQLSELTPDQQNDLYNQFCEKLAQEEGEEEGGEKKPPFPPKKEEGEKKKEKEEEEEEKESAARAEYAAQQEWQQKTAEADYLGRQMAHAFWDESGEIQKEAGRAGEMLSKGKGAVQAGGEAVKKFTQKVRGKTLEAGHKAEDPGLREARKALGAKSGQAPETAMRTGKEWKRAKGEVTKARQQAAGGALMTGAAGVGAGGIAAAAKKKKDREKAASVNFDFEACKQAMLIAESAELGDLEDISTKVASVYNLDLLAGETEKVAQTNDYDTALNVRGLEFLEAAGCDVDWNEVFS